MVNEIRRLIAAWSRPTKDITFNMEIIFLERNILYLQKSDDALSKERIFFSGELCGVIGDS